MNRYRFELGDGSIVLIEADVVETDDKGAYFYTDPDGDRKPNSIGHHGTSELVAFVPVTQPFSKVE